MAKVKNTARGPRGLRNDKGELVMIDPGQEVEGDFSASEVSDFKAALKDEAPAPEADEDEAAAEGGEGASSSGSRRSK